jgi:hypothetical protein
MSGNVVLTNQDVLELVAAKVPTAVILDHIHSHSNKFDLSTAAIIKLTQAGVPAAVIEAMHRPVVAGKPKPETTKQTAAQAAAPQPAAAQPIAAPMVEHAATPAPAPPPNVLPPPADKGRAVQVLDGIPFPITLAEDVAEDPKPGQILHFKAANDVVMGGTVVVSRGAEVTGQVVDAEKKKLIGRSKPTYRLMDALAVDGSRLKVRSAPSRRGDTPPDRPIEPIGARKSKDVLAPAGSTFLAYFDGPQTVTVHTARAAPVK